MAWSTAPCAPLGLKGAQHCTPEDCRHWGPLLMAPFSFAPSLPPAQRGRLVAGPLTQHRPDGLHSQQLRGALRLHPGRGVSTDSTFLLVLHRCWFRASLWAGRGGLAAQGPCHIPGRGTVGWQKPGPPTPASSFLPQVVLWQDHQTGIRAVIAQCGEPERDLPSTRKRDHERYEHACWPVGTESSCGLFELGVAE